MLVGSQVALSIQLPFAVIPLVYFTAKEKCMSLDLIVKVQDLCDKKEVETTEQKSMSFIDRTLARLRFSKDISDWFRFPQFAKMNKQSVRDYFITKNKNTTTTTAAAASASASTSSSVHTQIAYTELKEVPAPLTYQNSLISNIFACAIALLLLGLNSYLVVSLFMQI
jgi:metal iron transporter